MTMVLKDLLSISGQGGLFKFISQGRNGVIVENIETKKRSNIPASAKMSSLEDIAIFTESEEVPLAKVMDKIFEKEEGKETISHKTDNESLKKLMAEVLPDYDKDRVYVSDMKKLIQWYNILHQNNMLIKEEEKKEDEKEENAYTDEEKNTTANKNVKQKQAQAKPKKPVTAQKTVKKENSKGAKTTSAANKTKSK